MRWPVSLALVLLCVPPWSGEPRRPLFTPALRVVARPFVPAGGWPARIGALEPVGALTLSANEPEFGGFSALALHRGHAILLTDGGLVVRLRIAGDRLTTLRSESLDEGPETGWSKAARDTESLAVDAASGRAWIGYERINAIFRYTADFRHAQAAAYPPAMHDWGVNSSVESLVQLRDGRFLALREGRPRQIGSRPALIFAGDPAFHDTRVASARYLPPSGYAPSDAAVLPDGDVLVLNRRWRFPLTFDTALVRIPAAQVRGGALLHGPVVARLGAALGHENAEGLAVAQENGRTMIWLVTDNDGAFWRRTLLAKFRWRG
ncbi:hypothetical protein J2Y58_000626 [Sphingomonas sp. BE138]|uniref:esterase-like activity of phytase family protein n=1 Tax=Sphingomonas sp. BE138 TaxID=2817845 RepID=UPI00285DE88F|nr:esterase-like activity of phytase family protein [Sphingomonas sp. BE138]MDR6787285.1 hypothetical protein [Sphingomonas sp. BE138]